MRKRKKDFKNEIPEQMLDIARTMKTLEYQCQGLIDVAGLYMHSDQKSKADALLQEALDLTGAITDDEQKAEILCDMGIMCAKLGKLKHARKIMSKSIQTASGRRNPLRRITKLNSIFERCASEIEKDNLPSDLISFLEYYALETINLIDDPFYNSITLICMAQMCIKLKRKSDAAKMLSSAVKAVDAENKSIVLSDYIAPAYLKLGQIKKATKTIFQAFRNTGRAKDEECRLIHLNMFYLFAGEGMKDIAINILNKKKLFPYLREICGKNILSSIAIAELYTKIGMKEEASALLSEAVTRIKALDKDKSYYRVLHLQDIAKNFLEMDNKAGALSALSLAVEISKTGDINALAGNLSYIADTYLSAGEKATAIDLLNQALETVEKVEPLERKIWSLIEIGRAFVKTGQNQRASVILHKSIKLTEKGSDDRLKSFNIAWLSDLYKSILNPNRRSNK